MRALLLTLCLSATASAQAPLFPDGTAQTRAAPHWRIGASGGFANGMETATGSLSAERAVRGPYAVGGRVAAYGGSGFVDDGSSAEGVSLDAFATAGTRDRVLDLRAGLGAGLAFIDYSTGGLGCFPGDDGVERCPKTTETFVPLAYALGLVGADLYLTAGVGLGAEVRLAWMDGPPNVSSAEVGLRVRLAR